MNPCAAGSSRSARLRAAPLRWPLWLAAPLFAAVALPAVAQTAPGAVSPVAGDYLCVAGATCPCQSDGLLKLAVDGRWYWGSYTGRWQADATRVRFDGLGGAAALGPAGIGAGTLTFNDGSGNPVVCWQPRPGVTRPGSAD